MKSLSEIPWFGKGFRKVLKTMIQAALAIVAEIFGLLVCILPLGRANPGYTVADTEIEKGVNRERQKLSLWSASVS
ncbi:MAG: hypothetical protein ACP5SH_10075 [Syntrophobacteraceae bacterium]